MWWWIVHTSLCQCLSITRGTVAVNGCWTSIKTHCEWCFLVLRNPDGGPTEAMYTGSYSTHRAGMITTGCPGSSPHTPESLKGKKRNIVKYYLRQQHSDNLMAWQLSHLRLQVNSARWPGLSQGWEAGNLLSDCRPAFHGYQRRRGVTWTNKNCQT